MKGLPLNIALTIWLCLSGSIWLFGSLWIGEVYLPTANGANFVLLDLPWLILIALFAKIWLSKALRHD